MLPPVLEIYVIWHPNDSGGEAIAQELIDHFHGTAFSGLIGGAIEIYVRSAPWSSDDSTPRPLPIVEGLPYGLPTASLTAAVPVAGRHLATAVETGEGGWDSYIEALVEVESSRSSEIGIFPAVIEESVFDETKLGKLLGRFQALGEPDPLLTADRPASQRCRDLAQAIAMRSAETGEPLTVFVSHTKHATESEGDDNPLKIERVRNVITKTRLPEFFDAADLRPGDDWAAKLAAEASHSALLAVRTDLYSSRGWCQREVAVAKRAGMPMVILDALHSGEERGSFLMDHVPRVPSHGTPSEIPDEAILGALNRLVDECLKRELWRRQEQLAESAGVEVAWWAAHAPEPLTLIDWLRIASAANELDSSQPLRVLHPDPPLGSDEVDVLQDICALAGLSQGLDVLTPRGLAARGG